MQIINNRFLNLYDYNFLQVIENIFSVNSTLYFSFCLLVEFTNHMMTKEDSRKTNSCLSFSFTIGFSLWNLISLFHRSIFPNEKRKMHEREGRDGLMSNSKLSFCGSWTSYTNSFPFFSFDKRVEVGLSLNVLSFKLA